MVKNKNILVVGASIAGPAVCYWLKKFGFSPTLIEKNNGVRQGGYAIDLRGIAVELAKRMGIHQQLCEKRTRLHYARDVDTDGNKIHDEVGERSGFRQEDELELARGDLVNILMACIGDVPCHFNQSIAQIQQDNDKVDVTFNDGHSETFDLLIGADGLHSSTRRLVFGDEHHQLFNLGAYISVFDIPNYLQLNHCEWQYQKDKKHVSIVNYGESDSAFAGFSFRSDHQLENIKDVRQQQDFLRHTFKDHGWESNKLLQLMEQSNDFYFDSITQVKMDSWSKGRVALVGDAGYCASPFSGQGTSLALVGAYILAGELKKTNGDIDKAFLQYDKRLHPFVASNQAFGEYVNNNYFTSDELSPEATEKRNNTIIEKLAEAANAITLPDYG